MPYSRSYSSRATAHGSLPGLRTGHEPGPEPIGDRRGQDEATRLDTDDPVDLDVVESGDEVVDRSPERRRVAEQRRDVTERHARLGVVGDRPDVVTNPQLRRLP